MLGWKVAIDQDQIDAHGREAVELFLRSLAPHHHGALETLHHSHESETHRGVAGRVLDDRVADGEPAVGHGLLDHVARDAVLDAAHGIHELDLGEDLAAEIGDGAIETDQGVQPMASEMRS